MVELIKSATGLQGRDTALSMREPTESFLEVAFNWPG